MKNREVVIVKDQPNFLKKGLGFFVIFFSFVLIFPSISSADITSNLEGWWKLDDGSGRTALDSSGNGNTGTLSSTAPTWTTGELGGALNFNGNSYVSIPSSSNINNVATNNQITISAWIKVSSLNNTYQEIARQNNWFLLLNTSNQISMSTSGASAEYTNGFSFTADNQWHLITGTFDGTTIRLYEDGILQKSYAGGALSSNATPLYIGAFSGSSQYFSGSMDDVRIYSRALSGSDILLLYGKTTISLTTDNTSYTTTPANVLLTATVVPVSGATVQNVEFYSKDQNGVSTDLGAGQDSTTANTYILTWNNAPSGIYSMTAVVTDSTQAQSVSLPVTIYVNTSQLLYTVNGYGMQSLKYNGQQFIVNPAGSSDPGLNITFQTPGGTLNSISPWTASMGTAKSTSYSGSNCSQVLPSNWSTVSPGSNPVCNQQIYSSGKPDGYTLSTLYTTSDPKTLKIDYYVTNNDTSDTLEKFSMEYFMELTAPDITNTPGWLDIGAYSNSNSPVAFITGTWGSMALFTDDYSNNAYFGDVWTMSAPATNPNFLWFFSNYSAPGGGDPSNTKTDIILPGQTYHYALYIRFGTPTDTASTLASQAYSQFGQTVPLLLNWPDRRPIARWFMAGGQYLNASNPRGWSSAINTSSQANFNSSVLKWVNNQISYFNTLSVRPQGVLIWDLEGEEFSQPFTYVGNPSQLPNLAPEMDAVADQMFAAFKTAGYQVGMTLRPSNFQTGTSLPATCNYNATNGQLSDVFILTTAQYPYRGYYCSASNVWIQAGANKPNWQTMSNIDTVILSWLEAKISYAHNRWGARIFYVDSTVYTGGGPFNYNIFRQLQVEFPDCLFMPENHGNYFYGASSTYSSIEGYGQTAVPWTAQQIWPNAFTVVEAIDDVDTSNDGTSNSYYNTLVSSVKEGNSMFMDGWWGAPGNADIESMYQSANVPSSTMKGYGLTVAVSGTGSANVLGTIPATINGVTSNPQEINCPSANCVAAFDGGTPVTLTAVPATGSIFSGWSGGGCSGSTTTCVVTMNSSQTVTANFSTAPTQFSITSTNTGNGFGMVFGSSGSNSNLINCGVNSGATICSATVNTGTAVILTATPASSSVFSGWTITGSPAGTCTGITSPCTVTVNATTAVIANFTVDTTPPSVPTGLTATPQSATQINLAWTASTDNVGVTGYNIYRGGVKVCTSATASYSDTGLTSATAYSYTVSAYDAAGNNSAQSASVSASTMSGISNFVISNITSSGATLTWHTNAVASSMVDYGLTSNYGLLGGQNDSVTTHTAILTGLSAATVYHCRARSQSSTYSAVSPDQTFTTATGSSLSNIFAFTPNPSTISPGQSATLSWTVVGAISVSIDNGLGNQSSVSSGSVTVNPTQTTTYTLTATNANGSMTAQATVTVNNGLTPVNPISNCPTGTGTFASSCPSGPAGTLATFTVPENFGVNHPDQVIDFDYSGPYYSNMYMLDTNG